MITRYSIQLVLWIALGLQFPEQIPSGPNLYKKPGVLGKISFLGLLRHVLVLEFTLHYISCYTEGQ